MFEEEGENGEEEKTQKEVADKLRNISELYIEIRKEDYKKNEKTRGKSIYQE